MSPNTCFLINLAGPQGQLLSWRRLETLDFGTGCGAGDAGGASGGGGNGGGEGGAAGSQ